jgi:predicted metal-dependent phosphoesterase TrpH
VLADLHVHTTASDGTYSPREVVEYAKQQGLSAVGITDHDTVLGLSEADKTGKPLSIDVVPGVEMNTDHEDAEVHILGYYIDYTDSEFLDLLAYLRKMRFRRVEKMFHRLTLHGLKLSFDDVVRDRPTESIGRPHLASAIVKAGYAVSSGEAFSKFLVRGSPGWVRRYAFSPVEAIRAIQNARGIPVLAHPGLIGNDMFVRELTSAGLMGLEAFHSEHTPQVTKHYQNLARRMGLLATGGSDFHGHTVDGRRDIGDVAVPYSVVQKLKRMTSDL